MSRSVLNPSATRELLVDHIEMIEGAPEFGEPTTQALTAFGENLDELKKITHKTSRGKREISIDLSMTVSELEELFIGKSVLDIGCGQGRFSSEIARLKKTKVTALDSDPEVLEQVRGSKNLTPVLGSGLDLQSTLGDEEFDVVVSAYSSLLWARNPEEKSRALQSAIRACRVGGKTIFIPIAQHLEHRKADRRSLGVGIVRGFPNSTPEDLERLKDAQRVHDWNDVVVMRELLGLEEQGAVDCTFVSSRDNARGLPVTRMLNGPNDPTQECYSVIADVVSR